jgi:hypothetical protein
VTLLTGRRSNVISLLLARRILTERGGKPHHRNLKQLKLAAVGAAVRDERSIAAYRSSQRSFGQTT